MRDPVDALVLDLLEWLGPAPKRYAEVMDVWRTSCPRLPVWEQANESGFIAREHRAGIGAFVSLSPVGRSFLSRHRQRPQAERTCRSAPAGRP